MSARLLIADDEPAIMASLEFLFRQAGYEIALARDGEAALATAKKFKPDLALLDFMLPRMSGLDVCRHLRADPQFAQMKVLILSARGTARDQADGEQAGADGYYVKPFATKALLAEVARLLAQREA